MRARPPTRQATWCVSAGTATARTSASAGCSSRPASPPDPTARSTSPTAASHRRPAWARICAPPVARWSASGNGPHDGSVVKARAAVLDHWPADGSGAVCWPPRAPGRGTIAAGPAASRIPQTDHPPGPHTRLHAVSLAESRARSRSAPSAGTYITRTQASPQRVAKVSPCRAQICPWVADLAARSTTSHSAGQPHRVGGRERFEDEAQGFRHEYVVTWRDLPGPPPVVLDVLAMIALGAGQAERVLLQDRVAPVVPQRQSRAPPLPDVAEPGQAVLAPPAGARPRVIVRRVVPGPRHPRCSPPAPSAAGARCRMAPAGTSRQPGEARPGACQIPPPARAQHHRRPSAWLCTATSSGAAHRVIRPSCYSSGNAGRPQYLLDLRAGPAGSPSVPTRASPSPRRE